MDRLTRPVALLALLAAAGACALNPIGQMSLEDEVEEGRKAVEAIRGELGLVQDDALTEYVKSIGTRLAEHSPRKDVTYQFYVVDREEVNAFAVPGGHVFVTRGLLALADSEDELANVVGHEVGHVAARHYAARSWRKTGGSLLATLGGVAGSFLGLGELTSRPGRGLVEGHNRDQEREADELGQQMAARAGWSPIAMSEFLRKLERDVIIALGARPEESILDSHPATAERIAASQKRAATFAAGSSAKSSREDYLQRISGLTIGQDPRGGVFKDELFLHPDLNLRIRFPEDWITLNRPAFVAAVDPPVQIRVEFAGSGKGGDDELERKARAFLKAQSEPEEKEEAKKPEPAADAAAKDPDGAAAEKPAAGSAEPKQPAPDPKPRREFPDFQLKKRGKRLLGRQRTAFALDGEFFKGQGTARVYFLRVGDSAYRVTCAMPTQLVSRYMEDCDRTASSMRSLRKEDRAQVQWTRLEVIEVRPGETLRAFNVRTQNKWTESQTAAANGLTAPYELRPGQRLKIARAQIYESQSAPATSGEPEEEPDDPPKK
jgi:predicted Zn-dependent protease